MDLPALYLAAIEGGSAKSVAWICFVLGILLVLGGVWQGLRARPAEVKQKADEIKAEGEAAAEALKSQATSTVRNESLGGVEALEAESDAKEKTEVVKGKFGELASLVESLPEHLRFAGLLIVIGAALISVATVQFGGTSLF